MGLIIINGFADEDVTSTFYVDSDGDGFGNENIDIQAKLGTNGICLCYGLQ